MIIENHNGINVLRDDLLPGGTKSIFIGQLLDPTKNFYVYASPVYGGFQIALAHYCTSIGKKAVIFCAYRGEAFQNTLQAKAAGAIIYQVHHGYLSNCTSKAKLFCEKTNNAQLIKFGANYPQAIVAIAERMRLVTQQLGKEPEIIYCAVGSGTLLKGLINGTDKARIIGVMVGAEYKEAVPDRVELVRYPKPFQYESKAPIPFPSCANYDRKAWEICLTEKDKSNVLFWNVL